jgi:hypothetical protein
VEERYNRLVMKTSNEVSHDYKIVSFDWYNEMGVNK